MAKANPFETIVGLSVAGLGAWVLFDLVGVPVFNELTGNLPEGQGIGNAFLPAIVGLLFVGAGWEYANGRLPINGR